MTAGAGLRLIGGRGAGNSPEIQPGRLYAANRAVVPHITEVVGRCLRAAVTTGAVLGFGRVGRSLDLGMADALPRIRRLSRFGSSSLPVGTMSGTIRNRTRPMHMGNRPALDRKSRSAQKTASIPRGTLISNSR